MDRPVYETKAWRVTFAETAPPDETPYVVVLEPDRAVAIRRPVDVDEALAEAPAGEPGNGIDLIWMPPAVGSSQDIERSLEPPPRTAGESRRPPIRANLRSSRVVWTNARAMIATAPDQLADAMDAVIRFTLAERHTIELERDMTEVWPQIEAFKALTHRVTRRQLAQQSKIDALTERATRMKVNLLRLQAAVEQLDPRLTSGSKRLYAELVLQAGVSARLEMLEDPVGFAGEHFERANTRLIEARNALTGFYLEALIIVVLAAEFAAFFHAKL
jgi:hypothetical protein